MLVIDRGSYPIVWPVPEDAGTALCGAYAGLGQTAEQARAGERVREQETVGHRPPT